MSSRERPRKPFSIRLDGRTYLAEREARLILSDRSGEFDHPEVQVSFAHPSSDLPTDPIRLVIGFQRHLVRDAGEEVDGYMDTCRPWSRCYAARIEFRTESHSVSIVDRPFRMCVEDRLAIAFARQIAYTINEYNLRLVDQDDCVQVLLALEKLGFSMRHMYRREIGKPVELWEIDDRGANRRAAAKRDARPTSPASPTPPPAAPPSPSTDSP